MAEPLLQVVVHQHPDFLIGWLTLALVQLKLHRLAEALDSYSRAIELQPNSAEAWLGKGKALLRLGHYADALTSFDKALEGQVSLPEIWVGRGVAYRQLGQLEEAEAAFAQAKTLGADPVYLERTEILPQTPAAGLLPTIATPSETVLPSKIPQSRVSLGDGQPALRVEAIPALSEFEVAAFCQIFIGNLQQFQGKSLESATPHDCYQILARMIHARLRQFVTPETALKQGDLVIGELSAEYMPGPHLPTTLVNLGLSDAVRQGMQNIGVDLDDVMAQEAEPGLGRGGLGRLLVDYLESCATQQIPAIGYGIRYELGNFNQKIQDGWQIEIPDEWLKTGNSWEVALPDQAVVVHFGGHSEACLDEHNQLRMVWRSTHTVTGIPYDTYLPGYHTQRVSPLRLWQAEPAEDISTVLYPVDVGYEGKRQRLKQQYFLVSCALQDMVRMHINAGYPLTTLPERVTLQLNDTDTLLAIPELMRLLMDERGMEWATAWQVTERTFAYTNHSLLPESLDFQHYPLHLMQNLLPRHLGIIFAINDRFLTQVRADHPDDHALISQVSLIEESGDRYVRMANLACVGTYSINGVSIFHTDLLKQKLLTTFCDRFPEKFTAQTNGISQRRFLKVANPDLAALITERIGADWLADLTVLSKLEPSAEDSDFRTAWQQVKQQNKQHLAAQIQQQTGLMVNTKALFDIQAAIIHEYKRPHLTLLYILTLYQRIKANPGLSQTPRVVIFAGKAAPDYGMAKLIIRLMHAIADLVNQDPDMQNRLQVVFLPNFSLQTSLPIYRAADLAEYISLAGTEASETGNMIAALNGALLVGTQDGSNIELFNAIGTENGFSFGLTQPEVENRTQTDSDLNALITSDAELATVLALLGSETLSCGHQDLFQPLLHRLCHDDPYFTLTDYRAYITCQDTIAAAFLDRDRWLRQSILTTARIGQFTADRAVQSYQQQIWRSKTSVRA